MAGKVDVIDQQMLSTRYKVQMNKKLYFGLYLKDKL